MCLDLLYVNSEYCGVVEFAYLAVGDDIIIDRSVVEEDEDTGESFINTHGGNFNSHLWLQWCDAEDKQVLTALLCYMDQDEWEGSLSQQLVFLNNNDYKDEIVSNLCDMFNDAIHNSGFCGTLVGNMIDGALGQAEQISWRTVDFQMHEASPDVVHPCYDT